MKRSNEFAVGLAVLGAAALITVGAIALGQLRIGRGDEVRTARFRSIGGIGKGAGDGSGVARFRSADLSRSPPASSIRAP